MIEQVYKISTGNEKAVEKVIYDDNLHYLHMIFNKNEGVYANLKIGQLAH
ncbi:cupin domain-containing protein [Acidilutibacter cellobiosedens]|nr:hypothetical protein [Acidilutibacter cellobiosedens]